MNKPIPDEGRPWFPIPIAPHLKQIHAVRAVMAGRATDDQQKAAMDFIIDVVAWRERSSYFPDNARDGDFAEGRRFVSEQLVKISKLKVDELEKIKAMKQKKP